MNDALRRISVCASLAALLFTCLVASAGHAAGELSAAQMACVRGGCNLGHCGQLVDGCALQNGCGLNPGGGGYYHDWNSAYYVCDGLGTQRCDLMVKCGYYAVYDDDQCTVNEQGPYGMYTGGCAGA